MRRTFGGASQGGNRAGRRQQGDDQVVLFRGARHLLSTMDHVVGDGGLSPDRWAGK